MPEKRSSSNPPATDLTIPSRATLPTEALPEGEAEPAAKPKRTRRASPAETPTPWVLQQHFDGEGELETQLAARFANMPLMSIINLRSLGKKNKCALALLSTQDGAATLVFELNLSTRALHLSYTVASMLSLRFQLDDLSDADRAQWLNWLRDDLAGPAFLWGQARWEADYVVCVTQKYATTLFAFSPSHVEAAARMTHEVRRKLVDWLQSYWQPELTMRSPKLKTW